MTDKFDHINKKIVECKTTREVLATAPPTAEVGVWEEAQAKIASLTERVRSLNWHTLFSFTINNTKYDLIKFNTLDTYMVVKPGMTDDPMEEVRPTNNVYFFLSLEETSYSEKLKLNKKSAYNRPIWQCTEIGTSNAVQGGGIAKTVLLWLLKDQKKILCSGPNEFFPARVGWSRISNRLDLVCDLVDIDKYQVLQDLVKVHQGLKDSDFDKRLWDYGNLRNHVLLVVRDVV